MNPDVLTDIQKRLRELGGAVRYRAGEVTGTAPLDVALGGASTSYEDVRSLESGLDIGDQVAVLVFGNDLLVLGRIQETESKGSSTATWTAAIRSATAVVPHGLGAAPVYASAESRDSDISYSVTGRDATNINVVGFYLPGANISGTFTFDWKAEL